MARPRKYVKPPKSESGKPNSKILFFDLETTPLFTAVWDTGKQYVNYTQILPDKDRTILSWAAKWSGKSEVMYHDTSSKKDKRDDLEVVKSAKRALDEADVVIWQNGKRFDEKIVRTRCAKYELGEPDPYQSVDTLQIMRQNFKLPSYSLGYALKFFGIGEKYTSRPEGYNGLELWLKCLGIGCTKSEQKKGFEVMRRYNPTDVTGLEALWEYINPYAKGVNYVNPNLYISMWDEDGNPVDYICQCGSTEFHRNGFSRTQSGKYLRWKCKLCRAHHREKGTGKNLRPTSRRRV